MSMQPGHIGAHHMVLPRFVTAMARYGLALVVEAILLHDQRMRNRKQDGIITLWPQPLPKRVLMLPSSNLHWQNSIELTARLVLAANLSLADWLFLREPQKTNRMRSKVMQS